MNRRLSKIIRFLKEIEKLKLVKRIPYLSDKKTLEDDAQHSWHIAMMFLVLEKEFKNKFDSLKILKMILVHDLVEIHTGDDWVTTKEEKMKKHLAEIESANKIFPILPTDLSKELRTLWEEYDKGKTTEAKIAKGLDKLSYSLQYVISNKINWPEEGNIMTQREYARPYLEDIPAMFTIMESILKENEGK
jgi:putative hydrolases of HD superfamily